MHSPIRGSHCAKFDDEDFNNFRGIACGGQTTHRQTHRLGSYFLKFANVADNFANKNLEYKSNSTEINPAR